MWKKNEEASQPAPTAPTPAPRSKASQKASVIGPSIRIKGNLTGQEDLVIQGQIQGEVRLKSNNVTVGKEGRIRADIYGRTVHVEGEVKGHLFGEQEVVIRASGKVQGDIVSPRVVLENGSNFKGSIDMEPVAAKAQPTPDEKKKPAQATLAGSAAGSKQARPSVTNAPASGAKGADDFPRAVLPFPYVHPP